MVGSRIAVDLERFARLADLSVETAASLLESARTRIALHVVSSCDPQLPLDRLAAAVAEVDAERARSAVRVSLIHVTFPKFEDYGLLEYELRAGLVRLEGPVVDLPEPIGTRVDGDGLESIGPDDRD